MSQEQAPNTSGNQPVSVWQHKPWWCQPWSIALTGFTVIGGSWFWLRIIWLTVLVAVPVLVWMGFFLLVYPRLMAQSGILSTYSQNDPK